MGGRKKIRLFVCGPTVFDYIHIGNARTFLIYDIFTRYLRSIGVKVFNLQNITDIDDKIIKRARETNITPKAIALKFEKAYKDDIKKLGIDTVTKYAPATKYIKQIVKQIKTLIQKGHAYKIEGDGYYFDLSTFPEYGKLSKRTTLQAEDAVSRIDESVNKRNKGDFALWKFSKPGEPYWNNELGRGRPGWHIEDTAITDYYFGPQYDIHGGAIELKFPHHEAEIAQQESASGKKPLVKIWMHAGILLVNGQKMSKSLGNFISVRDYLEKRSVNILRYIVASHHYRSPIDYNEQMTIDAQNALAGIQEFLAKLSLAMKRKSIWGHRKSTGLTMSETLTTYQSKFTAAMDDDFNTPEALAVIFNLINEINPKIWSLDKKEVKLIVKWLNEKLKIFKIAVKLPKIPLKIRRLAKGRELLRANQQFIQADPLRKQIESLGYKVEDTPVGPLVLEKSKIQNPKSK